MKGARQAANTQKNKHKMILGGFTCYDQWRWGLGYTRITGRVGVRKDRNISQ